MAGSMLSDRVVVPSGHKEGKSSPRRTSSAKKKVRFAACVRITPIIHVSDMGPDLRQAIWYQRYEVVAFKEEAKETIVRMDRTSSCSMHHDRNTCVRGLESLTPSGQMQRRWVRQDSIEAVMAEQDIQWTEGVVDPIMIAYAYGRRRPDCERVAYQRGLQDQLRSYSRDDRGYPWTETAVTRPCTKDLVTSRERQGGGVSRDELSMLSHRHEDVNRRKPSCSFYRK